MRTNKKESEFTSCISCGITKDKCLDMFDLMVGDTVLTICDSCNKELFRKSLRASCYTDSRLKTKHDIKIITNRKRNRQVEGVV